MAIGSTKNSGRTVLSEINVTPFVDVMLVLLVIFMVTTPILYQGIKVDLPKTESKPIPSIQREKKVVVTVNKKGEIFIEKKKYRLSNLKIELRNIFKAQGRNIRTEQVFLRSDQSVSYGTVVKVMGEIKKSGVEKLGLITQPSTNN